MNLMKALLLCLGSLNKVTVLHRLQGYQCQHPTCFYRIQGKPLKHYFKGTL